MVAVDWEETHGSLLGVRNALSPELEGGWLYKYIHIWENSLGYPCTTYAFYYM